MRAGRPAAIQVKDSQGNFTTRELTPIRPMPIANRMEELRRNSNLRGDKKRAVFTLLDLVVPEGPEFYSFGDGVIDDSWVLPGRISALVYRSPC